MIQDAWGVVGYALIGFVLIVIGFIPGVIAFWKKNRNAQKVVKLNLIAVLGLGILGLGLSILFQSLQWDTEVWALIVLGVIVAVQIAAWVFLVIMAVKDKEF